MSITIPCYSRADIADLGPVARLRPGCGSPAQLTYLDGVMIIHCSDSRVHGGECCCESALKPELRWLSALALSIEKKFKHQQWDPEVHATRWYCGNCHSEGTSRTNRKYEVRVLYNHETGVILADCPTCGETVVSFELANDSDKQ